MKNLVVERGDDENIRDKGPKIQAKTKVKQIVRAACITEETNI